MKQKRVIPVFKSEAEEAEWWYRNRAQLDRDLIEPAQKGEVKRLGKERLKARLTALKIARGLDPAPRE